MPKISLIISFYNNIRYLKYVLAGLTRQDFKDFDVIIADDGSSVEVVSEIEKISKYFAFNIIHLWHSDKGFRKNRILNHAIALSSSPYIVIIDGDCVPHSKFLSGHYNYKAPGFCLTGRRVNVSDKITNLLTNEKVAQGFLETNFYRLIYDGLFGKSGYVEKGFHLSNEFLLNKINSKKRGVVGCNFSAFKSDFLTVNGFDERYEAPAVGEDTDIQYRLELAGIRVKSLNHIAIQYHLYHKFQDRNEINLKLFEEVKKSGVAFTPYGIKK